MKVAHLFGLWGPWWRQVCRDMDCLCTGVMALSESFFEFLVAGDQKAPLASLSLSVAPPVQAFRGLPCLESFFDVWCISLLKEHPGWGPTL